MQDTVTRIFENLAGRWDGPLHFRFIAQPLMAIMFAIRDGRRDAREGRVPYFWALCTKTGHRRDLLRSGWKSIAKIFVFAVILDTVYQLTVFHWFYPFETVLVAVILAIIPYLLFRGPVNRLLGWKASTRNEWRHHYRY